MAYDYSRLIGRIAEKFGTQSAYARAMGTSDHTISKKLNGKTGWTQEEMMKSSVVLEFPETDIPAYFFKAKVQY